VIRGVILFLLLFILAPVISRFYDNGQIESILKVIAFSFLLSGFNNIGLILFNKELNFKKKVVYDQLTAILSIVATVSLAFWLRNVWALVLGNVTGAVIGTSLSYWAHPFRPRFSFRINIAKELFHFGKWIFLSGVILFFITQGDDALVGKVLGMSALGFYLLAYKLSNLPATAITNVISQVSFPAYSKIQHNIESLRNAYGRILKFTALISIPLAVGLFILATDFVRIAYGERWLPMVPAMMILCIFGLVRSLGATTGPLFQSVGKPHIVTQLCAAELLIIIIIIYPLSKALGIFGTSIAVTIPLCLINIFSAYKVSILLKDSIARYIKLLFPIVISTVIMAISLYIFKMLLGNSFSLVYLVLAIIASIIIYITSIVILDKESLNLFKLVKNI
jgi:O-antigen/teichoic acid export membrane protein